MTVEGVAGIATQVEEVVGIATHPLPCAPVRHFGCWPKWMLGLCPLAAHIRLSLDKPPQ
ncbi:MAG: hypothetical protein GDA43_21635 [Hormoscilla sp. SP5CHS1]|nr:hypothetical protein [Hormoscilla sp. SP5CHS1]